MVIFFSFGKMYAQNEQFALVKEVYRDWHTYSFNNKSQCRHIFISDSIDASVINCMKDKIQTQQKFYHAETGANGKKKLDSIELDVSEKKFILKQLDLLNKHRWQANIFPNAQKINPCKFDSLYSSIESIDPTEKLCYNVYTFSNPIFLRDNTLCLFYTEEKTFSNVEGEFYFYVLKKKQWKEYVRICYRGK